jgi:Luciferase-like monooxygenase
VAPPRVGVELGAPGADPGGWLAEATAYEAAEVDSLWVRGDGDDDPWVLLGALAAMTWRVRLGVTPDTAPSAGVAATLERLSRGRRVAAGERWSRASPAPGRRAWAEALEAATAAGVDGVIVPATPGLLDLLRNPDDEDDRGDLRLTYG